MRMLIKQFKLDKIILVYGITIKTRRANIALLSFLPYSNELLKIGPVMKENRYQKNLW